MAVSSLLEPSEQKISLWKILQQNEALASQGTIRHFSVSHRSDLVQIFLSAAEREREREKEIHLYRLVLLECQLELIYKSLDLVMAPRTSLGRLPHRMTAYASSGKSELHYCTIFTIILS